MQRIRAAFADSIYPGDDNLVTGSEWGTDDWPASFYRGKHWQELSNGEIQASYDSLPFLTIVAFQFYLPAFLIASLSVGDEIRDKNGRMVGDMIGLGLHTHLDPQPWNYDLDVTEFMNSISPKRYANSNDNGRLEKRVRGLTPAQLEMLKLYLEFERDEYSANSSPQRRLFDRILDQLRAFTKANL